MASLSLLLLSLSFFSSTFLPCLSHFFSLFHRRSIIPITRLNDHLETPCYNPANIGGGGGAGFNRSSSRLSSSGSHPNITGLASGSGGMGGVSTASGGMSSGGYMGGGGAPMMMTMNRGKQQQQAFVPQGFQRDFATGGGIGGVAFQQGGVYNQQNSQGHLMSMMTPSPYHQSLDGGNSTTSGVEGGGGGVYTAGPFANNHSSYMTGSAGGGYGDRSLRDDEEDEEFSSGGQVCCSEMKTERNRQKKWTKDREKERQRKS